MEELLARCVETFRALRSPPADRFAFNALFHLNRAACDDFADALAAMEKRERKLWETRFTEAMR